MLKNPGIKVNNVIAVFFLKNLSERKHVHDEKLIKIVNKDMISSVNSYWSLKLGEKHVPLATGLYGKF